MEYRIIGNIAVLTDRESIKAEGGKVVLSIPTGATLYLNGRAYSTPTGRVRISTVRLQEENTVCLRHAGGKAEGESLMWDGTTLTAGGYDREALLLAVTTTLTAWESRLTMLEETVARLAGTMETPLFS